MALHYPKDFTPTEAVHVGEGKVNHMVRELLADKRLGYIRSGNTMVQRTELGQILIWRLKMEALTIPIDPVKKKC